MLKYYTEFKRKFFSDIVAVPATLQSSYYRPLDGLRGFAILMMLLDHIGANHYTRMWHWHIDTHLGVHLFFVLSGFLITTLLIKEKLKTGSISLKRFYIRRVLRIVPLAYFFLVVVIVLNHYYRFGIPSFDFAASFLFLKNMPIPNVPLTAHFWSLAVEEQFYLTFPFLLAANINRYFYVALSIVIIVPLVAILGSYQLINTHQPVVKLMMYLFWKGPIMILIGSVASILLFKGILGPLPLSRYYLSGLILFLTAIVIRNKHFIAYHPFISEFVSNLILAHIVAACINSTDLLSIILKSRVLVGTGIISYSIYIWQELFIGTHVWQPWLSSFSHLPLYLLMLVKLVLIFAIALISYYFFESKLSKLRKKFR